MPGRLDTNRRPSARTSTPQATVFWQRIRQLQEEDVPVVAANRGGLMVQYAHLEGFIPVSHLGQVRGRVGGWSTRAAGQEQAAAVAAVGGCGSNGSGSGF